MFNKTFYACLLLILLGAPVFADENWPSFRGKHAKGVADQHPTVMEWDMDDNTNVLWKTPIPGLGHSCPIVWKDKLFVTTAVSSLGEQSLKVGLYGNVDAAKEYGEITWRLICLHKKTGEVLWDRKCCSGKPKIRRHTKGSFANATPCTDGKHVAAFFESEGLYCYDMEGKLLWKKGFGLIDQGAFDKPELQWGGGSSPVIHDGMLILLCDHAGQSFLLALNVKDGTRIWKTMRDEDTTWGSPTVCLGEHPQIIVNGYKHIGGYDIKTGKEIWKMRGGGDTPVPTPIVDSGLIYITNAHGRLSPLYAIKTAAKGDITLKGEATSNDFIPWSIRRGGNYMTTPIIHGDFIYGLTDYGLMTCWDKKTGEVKYRKRIGRKNGFTASPVIADNKIYYTGEKGHIYIMKTGPEFDMLSKAFMDETCMATPAVSEGVLFFRTRGHVAAVGKK